MALKTAKVLTLGLLLFLQSLDYFDYRSCEVDLISAECVGFTKINSIDKGKSTLKYTVEKVTHIKQRQKQNNFVHHPDL